MAWNMCRTFFTGFDELGVNVLFELKKRLAGVRAPSGIPLVPPSRGPANECPLQFLAVAEEIPEPPHRLFRRAGFELSDAELFDFEREVSAAHGDHARLARAFGEGLARLANINFSRYEEETGIALSTYSPALICVFDVRTYKDGRWKERIDSILSPAAPELEGKFHPHAVVFAGRTEANRSTVEELGAKFHTVFLFDSESDLILNDPDDRIDLAANFLHAAAMLDHEEFHRLFGLEAQAGYYSFGAAHVYYPKQELITDAVVRDLGDPLYGHEEGCLGERFRGFFVGKLRKVQPGEVEYPFSLGDHETMAGGGGGERTDEFFPDVRDSAANRSHLLCEEVLQWVTDHSERIKHELRREALVERVREITRAREFLKIYFERWHDNFLALEFILRHEVIQRAAARAEHARAVFLERWKDRVRVLSEEMGRLTDKEGNVVCEHNGELAFHFAARFLRSIREVHLPAEQRRKAETPIEPAPAATRDEVEQAMARVPRPAALLTRLVLFVVLMVFFWDDAHRALVRWTHGADASLPAWATGLLFSVPALAGIYWLGYWRKLLVLLELLRSYLQGCLEKHEERLLEIERELATGFLLDAAVYLRRAFAPRPGFFYHAVHRGIAGFEDLVEQGHTVFREPPNWTEAFYMNRLRVYRELQEQLKNVREDRYRGALSLRMPDPASDVYVERVSRLAGDMAHYGRVLASAEYAGAWADLPVTAELLGTSDSEAIQGGAAALVRAILAACGRLMREQLDEDPDFKDLAAFLHATGYRMDARTFGDLSRRASPTFKISDRNREGPKVLAGDEAFFSDAQERVVYLVPDRNSIIFLHLDGPEPFGSIKWRAEP